MSEQKLPFNLPEFKVNKDRSGYEIRTEILGLAKAAVMEEYHARFHGWEISAERDDKTGQIVTKVGMPEFPGLSQIMATAETMYSFINSSTPKK